MNEIRTSKQSAVKHPTDAETKQSRMTEMKMVQVAMEKAYSLNEEYLSRWIRNEFSVTIRPKKVANLTNAIWEKEEQKRQASIGVNKILALERYMTNPSIKTYSGLLDRISNASEMLSAVIRLQAIHSQENNS